jgi:hypothetical protein
VTTKPASFGNDHRCPRAAKHLSDTPLQAPLGGIIPGGGVDVDRYTAPSSRRLLVRLRKALREERRRGQAGHWSYDLNRHIALAEAHKTELSRLEALTGRSCGRVLGSPAQSRPEV